MCGEVVVLARTHSKVNPHHDSSQSGTQGLAGTAERHYNMGSGAGKRFKTLCAT